MPTSCIQLHVRNHLTATTSPCELNASTYILMYTHTYSYILNTYSYILNTYSYILIYTHCKHTRQALKLKTAKVHVSLQRAALETKTSVFSLSYKTILYFHRFAPTEPAFYVAFEFRILRTNKCTNSFASQNKSNKLESILENYWTRSNAI